MGGHEVGTLAPTSHFAIPSIRRASTETDVIHRQQNKFPVLHSYKARGQPASADTAPFCLFSPVSGGALRHRRRMAFRLPPVVFDCS